MLGGGGAGRGVTHNHRDSEGRLFEKMATHRRTEPRGGGFDPQIQGKGRWGTNNYPLSNWTAETVP